MRHWRTRGMLAGLVLAGVLALVSWYSFAAESFTALLDRADAVRSADPKRFLELLNELDTRADQATPAETERLRYLRTYRLSLGGKFDEAIAELRQLFEQAQDPNLKFRAGAFLVNNYAATREFAEGLAWLDRTLALLPQIQDNELRQQGLVVAAVLYNQVGQHELARHYADMVLAQPASGRSRCMAGYMRLEALFNLKALPADDGAFHDNITQCEAQHEVLVANYVRGYLARKWFAQGEARRGIELIEAHIAEIEATRYPRLIGEIQALLAEMYFAEGESAQAESHARAAIAQSGAVSYVAPTVTAWHVVYEIERARGNTSAALAAYIRFAEADKANLNDIKAREIAYQLAKQEMLQKTQTIELLNKQNEVLTLQERVATQAAQNTQLLAALLAVLLASIGYWAYRVKREQVRFRRLAQTDALTGVANRHHFTRLAEDALVQCARTGEAVSLVMFDLDRFKAINDGHGHSAGDWVLRRVAEVSRELCGKRDSIGRLGGEEFALLLVGADIPVAREVAETCRARLAAIDSAETGRQFDVSASFGVCATSQGGYDLTVLLTRADDALYRSKREGRGRVSVCDGAGHGPDGQPRKDALAV